MTAVGFSTQDTAVWQRASASARLRLLKPVIQRDREQELPEPAWIARVRRGDEDAARSLVTRLYPTIIKIVRGHLPRRTSEEDLTQMVFDKIFRNLPQFSGAVPLEHWVARIAVNTCLNELKYERCRPELRMSDLSEEQEMVVERLARTSEELPTAQAQAAREVVDQLLARLRPDERLVITLVSLEERRVDEVSRMTGWSMSLVKVKAFRARHKMRRLWKAMAALGQFE